MMAYLPNITKTLRRISLGILPLFYILAPTTTHAKDYAKTTKKKWTVIIYMAADNDLRDFSVRNIKQMSAIGSTELLNIVVQLDIKVGGTKKITRRYYIEKNKVLHMNASDPYSQAMDSGSEKTLVSCCQWAINDYPAEHYMLVLWNHGSGIIDPQSKRLINPFDLYRYNPLINKLELDRTNGFIDLISVEPEDDRGICWDDSTGNFLTNQKLDAALDEVCSKNLHKKFDVIGFDACLMAMLEVGNIIKNYANVMVGSQEVELGTGWNYQRIFEALAYNNLSAKDLGIHIVNSYKAEYNSVTNDYTQSAMNMQDLDTLEDNVNEAAVLFIECLKKQDGASFKNAIRQSKDRSLCTHFDEPSYIDLHHFYTNMISNISSCSFGSETDSLRKELRTVLNQGCSLINSIVLASASGSNLSKAKGVSIYFPDRRIHQSYRKTNFASNKWLSFLNHYLLV